MPESQVSEAPCPDCEGRGWVIEPDGGVGTARRCACRERQVVSHLLAAAGIPARYRGCRLETFKTTEDLAAGRAQLLGALKNSRRFVEGFVEPDGRYRETGLLFIGPPGVGKTHLAVAVLVELVERYRVRGHFVEFTSLVHQIQSTFDPRSPESKHEVLDPVVDAEVLVFDELGAQHPTPWVRDVLYLVINARYTRRRPTLFTTNYRLEEPKGRSRSGGLPLDRGADPERPAAAERSVLLAHRLPSMLVSRLCEMAKPVVLDAVSDYRERIKMPAIRL